MIPQQVSYLGTQQQIGCNGATEGRPSAGMAKRHAVGIERRERAPPYDMGLRPATYSQPEADNEDAIAVSNSYPPALRTLSPTNHIIDYPDPHPHLAHTSDVYPPNSSSLDPGLQLAGPHLIVSTPCREQNHEYSPSVTIHGGTFVGGNASRGEAGIHILHRAVALSAMHDPADSYTQPQCHPETRADMLAELMSWCTNSASPSLNRQQVTQNTPVLWLHGPAGAGKSAVMRTLSQQLAAAGKLGASFFFKRGNSTQGNADTLFATLAYQLALSNISQLKSSISQIVENDPSLVARSMKVQLERLVLEPCRSLRESESLTILVDGLDECDGHSVQEEILQLIASCFRKQPPPVKFILASRPEPHIREVFEGSFFLGLHECFNIQQSYEDIEKYLRAEFKRIYCEHHRTMANVPKPWPADKLLKKLIQNSSGYFIYAHTVIRFIDDKNFRPPERLQVIVENLKTEFDSPYGALDQLYKDILAVVPNRPRMLELLYVIDTFSELGTYWISQLLHLERGDLRLALHGLHSLLSIPEDSLLDISEDYLEDEHVDKDNFYSKHRISPHHASFYDFLKDTTRAGPFYINGSTQSSVIHSMLHLLSYNDDDPCIHKHGPIIRALNFEWTDYITRIPLSCDLVPLIHRINPTSIFGYYEEIANVSQLGDFILWLKV
ncbi:hypothetical protein C8J57DRAFT_138872 [Mycena rebaudengoi]|nr:hypothetical protein C8J57DRAFT_138872 [Mycena rebaudengoi]